MQTKNGIKSVVLFGALVLVAACGGGGGSDNATGENGNGFTGGAGQGSFANANELVKANHVSSTWISDPVAQEKIFKNATAFLCPGMKIPEGENYSYALVEDYYADGLMVSYVKSFIWAYKYPECVTFKQPVEDKAYVYKNKGVCTVDFKTSKFSGYCEIENPMAEFTQKPIRQEMVKGLQCDVYLWENPPAIQSPTLTYLESCEAKITSGMDLPRTHGIPQHMRLRSKSWYVRDGVTTALSTQEAQQIAFDVMVPRSLMEPHRAPDMVWKGN